MGLSASTNCCGESAKWKLDKFHKNEGNYLLYKKIFLFINYAQHLPASVSGSVSKAEANAIKMSAPTKMILFIM